MTPIMVSNVSRDQSKLKRGAPVVGYFHDYVTTWTRYDFPDLGTSRTETGINWGIATPTQRSLASAQYLTPAVRTDVSRSSRNRLT
jgi:hypothetical protein